MICLGWRRYLREPRTVSESIGIKSHEMRSWEPQGSAWNLAEPLLFVACTHRDRDGPALTRAVDAC